MVRDYLMRQKIAFVMQIWREGIKEPCEAQGFKYPTWADFGNYFSKLKRLELVVFDHKEPADDLPGMPITGRERYYYRLNPKKIGDPAWRNPIKALYPYLFQRK